MTIEVQLTRFERELAIQVAGRREVNNYARGVPEQKQYNGNSFMDRYHAHCAELAVGRTFNVYPDMSTSLDDAAAEDMKINGATTDTKWTRFVGGDLRVPHWKSDPRKRCQIYILTWGDLGRVTIFGFAKALDLFKDENLIHLDAAGRKTNRSKYVLENGDHRLVELNEGDSIP